MKKLISLFIILSVVIGSMGCTKEITETKEVNGIESTKIEQTEPEESIEQQTKVVCIDAKKEIDNLEIIDSNTEDPQTNDLINDNKIEFEESNEVNKPTTIKESTTINETTISEGQQAYTSDTNYLIYINDRFGFSIKYPEFLCNGEESFNGDGITLTNTNGDAELTVWGSHNVLEETVDSLYEEEINKHPNAAYKIKKDGFFVVSWVEEGKIFYQNTVVSEEVINTFVIQYPLAQKENYDSIVTEMYHSFYTMGQAGY